MACDGGSMPFMGCLGLDTASLYRVTARRSGTYRTVDFLSKLPGTMDILSKNRSSLTGLFK